MTLTQISTNGIKDANVNTADIADDAVTTAKIASNAVTSSKIAGSAVHSSKIIDAAVTTGKIADNAVISSKIADSAVSGSKLGSSVVSSTKIQDNAVTTTKIADEAVTLAKLPHGTSSNDGKFLRANNGADPTFETVTGTTINNNADNRVITGSGTANTLNGESTVVVDGNGRLGVGLSSPLHKIEALNGSDQENIIVAKGADTTTEYAGMGVYGGNAIFTGGGVGSTSTGMIFRTAASGTEAERLGIDSSGNVTIKTNDVALRGAGTLRINSGSTSGLLTLDGGSTNRGGEIGLYGGSNGGRILFRTGQGSGQQGEKMRLDENGNLGIGTADPDNMLQIQKANGGGDVALRVTNATSTDSGTTASLYLTTSPSTNFNTAYIQAKRDGGTLNFGYGSNAPGVVFYGPNGDVTCRKPVKTIQNTVVQDTVGDRFQIDLPSTSRMFRITGSFKFDGTGAGATYRIWGDLGSWSDSHSPALEGFANWWVNGATGDLEQDVISGRYFEVADPVDPSNCEVTYDLLVTTQAFNGSNSGQRPGVSGNISWTYSQVGRAWTVFSYQDINASGTDRLTSWSWDIDNVSGSMGTGTHHYVIEEYPLTAQ